jgi:hypothetical protein
MQGMREQAVQHGERAIELGKEDAAMVRPLLALALMQSGQTERAIHVLNDYVNGHAAEANASQIIASLTGPLGVTATPETIKSANDVPAISANTTAISMERNWLPPDVDETIPPVESGATCPLTDVLEKAGEQIKVLMHDVDRFTATESVIHESINKSGAPLAPEKRTFDYVVTIQEIRQGQLGVTEFRNGGGAQSEFPAGIATTGLPALVLIFHHYYVANYEMACEGLSPRNGLRVWQVHFLQRTGNGIKSYQFGINGPSYSVALKGRAWISAENYQIVRMETDLVAPMPDIRLFAEHTAVEYGPVQFRQGNVSLWLPQSADLYLDWRGRRMHRRHSFSQYQLFLVDENERISSPPNAQL